VNREQDLKSKRAALLQAISSGNGQACLEAAAAAALALDFRETDTGIGLEPVDDVLVDEVEELVVQALQQGAEAGIAAASRHLAEYHLGVFELEEALEHFAGAAEQGDADALLAGAHAIWEERDEAFAGRAFQWAHEASADDPVGHARHLLGLFRFNGFGCEEDLERSYARQRAAAEAGNSDAMFELYAMCSQGLGTEVDAEEALRWCVRSAQAGGVRAMYNLGAAYATGRGVEVDLVKSLEWYDWAANAGHGLAAATLGVMFAVGDGVDPDDTRAAAYFDLADQNGHDWRQLADSVGVEVQRFDPTWESEPDPSEE